ncbi:MAG: hypothetical protein GF307_01695 [candidate division Zixibacteria bacterium]|nr:hypothetical protein [candidate division Zixibacteria bacterium]
MKKITALIFTLAFIALLPGVSSAQSALPYPDQVWVDGMVYNADLSITGRSENTNSNGLYVVTNMLGQRPIGEAKPGDKDYADGNWQIIYLEFTQQGLIFHDFNGDGIADYEMQSWEEVYQHMLFGHVEISHNGRMITRPLKSDF